MKKENRYDQLAEKIVGLVGGKENIITLGHCVTRLRFNVRDKSKVDTEAVKKLPGCLGVQWSGDQLQVIIGQAVGDAYQLVLQKHKLDDLAGGEVPADVEAPKPKKNRVIDLLDLVAGCITPVVPALIAGGFIQIVVLLGTTFGLLAEGSGTHTVLTFAGNAPFYFLPIYIGGYTAKKLGGNTSLGMIVGALFIHPDFIAALEAGPLNIFGIPIWNASYSSSILPALLSVAVMVPIEKWIARHSPDAIRSILEPFVTFLIMLPIALCVTGPVGDFVGTYISVGIMWLYDHIGFIGVAIVACLWPLLVMTGMHHALVPYILNSFATLGFEGVCETAMIISNIDQGAACMAVAVKTKKKDRRSTAVGCGITAMVGGVTEPGMYGITLPLRTPLYCSMVGSFLGALVAGIGGAAAYTVAGSTGLLGGLPVYINGGLSNVLWMAAGVLVGIVASFVLTLIVYKDEAAQEV